VCNTEQTASCPDGSNPVIVPAGTFCTVVLNPTASSIATTQALMDAQALATAQSEVGNCAWSDFIWTVTANPGASNPPYAVASGSGMRGNFNGSAHAVCAPVASGNGEMDLQISGHINYAYGAGILKHHRVSATWVDNTDQFIENSIVLFSPNDGTTVGSMASHPINSGPWNTTVSNHFDFTAMYDGITPIPFHLLIRIQIYAGNVGTGCHDRLGTVVGSIIALD